MNKTPKKKDKNSLVNVEKIKELCADQKLSHAKLGRSIGLDKRDSISRRLKNQIAFTADELIRSATELGVPLDDLVLK